MKKKILKKVLSCVMAFVMVPGLCVLQTPMTDKVVAASAKKNIQYGVSMVANPTRIGTSTSAAWSGDYIYFGNYYQDQSSTAAKQPIKWRVLDTTGVNGYSSKDGCILLFSDLCLDQVAFAESDDTTEWKESNIARWLNSAPTTIYKSSSEHANNVERSYTAGGFLNSAFSDKEAEIIAYTNGTTPPALGSSLKDVAVGGRKVFLLGYNDVTTEEYGFRKNVTGSSGFSDITICENASRRQKATTYAKFKGAKEENGYVGSMLRSYMLNTGNNYIPAMGGKGYVYMSSATNFHTGVAPAMNVKKDAILFTTGANENKATTFEQVAPANISEWKCTLKDNNSMAINAYATISGDRLSQSVYAVKEGYDNLPVDVSHKALGSLSAEYTNVTVALSNEKGEILYYGSINNNTAATNSNFVIPSGLLAGVYTLSIYGEAQKGAKQTDYATGTPFSFKLEVTADGTHAHRFGAWTRENCQAAGDQKRTCTICGLEQTQAVAVADHAWASDYTVDIAATCTTAGSKSIHCTNCNATKNTTEIAVTGHSGGVATCSEKAICSKCDIPYGEYLNHNIDQKNWVKDGGSHWRICSSCKKKVNIAEHTWNAGQFVPVGVLTDTAYTTYTCTACGAEKTVKTTGETHVWDGQFTIDIQPGCTTSGQKSKHCTTCPERKDVTEIAPLGHEISSVSYQSNTEKHWKNCSRCNAKQSEENHVFTITNRYRDENNLLLEHVIFTCSICNKQVTRQYTADLTIPEAPAGYESGENKTDENSHMQPTDLSGLCIKIGSLLYEVNKTPGNGEHGTVSCKGGFGLKLKSVSIPATVQIGSGLYDVTEISASAFEGAENLKTVVIGENIETIGKKAFFGCKKLSKITIQTSKLNTTSVGAKAFLKAGSISYKKLKVKVPKSKKALYKQILKKRGLSSLSKIL